MLAQACTNFCQHPGATARWPRPWRLRIVLAVFFFAYFIGMTGSAHAEDGPSEAKVKATFLFKFVAYVEWPSGTFAQADSPIVISVVEADEIAAELAKLIAGRNVNNRPVQLRRLSANDVAAGSQVLFVGSAASGSRSGRLLGAMRSLPVLTITEMDDALTFDSVINFVVIDDQVRFDVSLPAAERSRLKISARLLSVAHQVVAVSQ